MAKRQFISDEPDVRVESLILEDGRHAERHTTVDADGNEVIEIFAEESRPKKLEKRIKREYTRVVSKETSEVVKDGEVAHQEVRSFEAEVPLQLRSRIGVVDHHKIVDGDYVRKDEIGKMIADGVVEGVSALMAQTEVQRVPAQAAPIFRAQEVVEKTVEESAKKDYVVNAMMAVIVLAQAAFFGWYFFM
jgi:hypothetical protein